MISKIIFNFSRRNFWQSAWFWWLLAAWQGLLAVVLLRALEDYLFLQPRLQSLQADSGLLMQVFLPVYHWLAPWLLALIAGLLFWVIQSQRAFWQHYGVAPEVRWQALVQLAFWLTLWLVLPLFFAGSLVVFGFFPELYQWLLVNLAFWLQLFAFAALALALFLWLPAAVAGLFLLWLWTLLVFWPTENQALWLPRLHWQSLAAGAVSWTAVAYFLFFITFFLGLAWCKALTFWHSLRHLVLFLLIIFLSLSLFLPLLSKSSGHWDVTRQKVHEIAPEVRDLAEALASPLTIKVFLGKDHALRPALRSFFAKYQRRYPEWQLQMIDPQQQPQAVPDAVTHVGQASLRLDDKQVIIDFLNDDNLALGLRRLLQNYQPQWWFISGHGEASLLADGQQGLRRWLQELQQLGMRVRQSTFLSDELLDFQEIPPIVVLAGNQLPLLQKELFILETFLEKGGRLLWLLPPSRQVTAQSLAIEEQLMQLLDTLRIPGVVVHAEADSEAAFLLPVTPAPEQTLVEVAGHFPYASAFQVLPSERWQVTTLLQSSAQSFADQGFTAPFHLDANEAAGALTVAVAYERQPSEFAEKAEKNAEKIPADQALPGRVLLLGSVAWLRNQFWDLPTAKALRENLWTWLYPQPPVIPFTLWYPRLHYPDFWLYGVSALLLLVMPLSWLLIGVFYWWQKKYA